MTGDPMARATSRSAGGSLRQRSLASGQRDEKRQPAGIGRIRDLALHQRLRFAVCAGRGSAPQPSGRGCRDGGAAEQRIAAGAFHQLPEIHHRHIVT